MITVFLMNLVLRSRAWTPQTGVERLVREVGEVAEPIGNGSAIDSSRGLVLVRGELWRAAATAAIPQERVCESYAWRA